MLRLHVLFRNVGEPTLGLAILRQREVEPREVTDSEPDASSPMSKHGGNEEEVHAMHHEKQPSVLQSELHAIKEVRDVHVFRGAEEPRET